MQTILLVEDNEMNRDLISRRLKRRGFEVVSAADGAAGVETAARVVPDLILMDIGLPILDGYEATRLIKGDPKTQAVPIIGLSAHAMSGDAEKALEAGCDDYDTKPIDWPRLLAKVQKLLEEAAKKSAEPKASADETPSGSVSPTGGHLLVVDDTPLHLEMLSGRLSRLGYSFTLARNPQEGLEAIASQTYDLALVDIGLEHQGQPLWQVLKRHPKGKDLGFLILSPIDLVSEAAAGLEEGAHEVLSQPFRTEELKHRLDAILFRLRAETKVETLRAHLEQERRRTEYLMRSWLPQPMLEELRSSRRLPPKAYPEVTVLSWDTSDFAQLAQASSDSLSALAAVQRLLVSFEDFSDNHKLQLVSIDSHRVLAAAGDFSGASDPAMAAASCAQQMLHHAREIDGGLGLRFGIAFGPAVVGVLGRRGCRLGIWGPPVAAAERLRQRILSPGPSKILVSPGVWARLDGRVSGAEAPSDAAEGPCYQLES